MIIIITTIIIYFAILFEASKHIIFYLILIINTLEFIIGCYFLIIGASLYDLFSQKHEIWNDFSAYNKINIQSTLHSLRIAF